MKVRRQFFAVVASLLAVSCVGDPRPAPTADRFPMAAGEQAAPTTPLVRQALETQADFDALEESLLRRMGVAELIAVYAKLAEGVEVAKDESAVLLHQRLALLHLRLGSRDGGFQDAFRVADKLRQEAPQSPHTQFLMGAITSLLMPPGSDGSYQIDPRRKDVALRLSQHWEQLLRLAPNYVGPSGRSAERIREDLALLKVAIADTAQPPAPEAAQPPAPEEAQPPAPEAAQPPAPEAAQPPAPEAAQPPAPEAAQPPAPEAAPAKVYGVVATADEATAQTDLHRLDGGDTMARRMLCRDRRERPLTPAADTRDVVRWVELRCAIELDEPDRALTWLVGLVKSGAATAPCRWLAKVAGGSAAKRQAVSEAMSARGLAGCTH